MTAERMAWASIAVKTNRAFPYGLYKVERVVSVVIAGGRPVASTDLEEGGG